MDLSLQSAGHRSPSSFELAPQKYQRGGSLAVEKDLCEALKPALEYSRKDGV